LVGVLSIFSSLHLDHLILCIQFDNHNPFSAYEAGERRREVVGSCDSDAEKTVRFKAMAAAKKAASLAANKVFAAAAHDMQDRKRMLAAAARCGEELQDSESSDVGEFF
jgi:hypothetical protein